MTGFELNILHSSDTGSYLKTRPERPTFDLGRSQVDPRKSRSSTLDPPHYYILS